MRSKEINVSRVPILWPHGLSKKVSGIYKITSPNGRIYIGQSKNIYTRWRGYLLIGKSTPQPLLMKSFAKHGIKAHIFEIVQYFDFYNLKLLDQLEKHYIRLYCTFCDWHKDISKKGLNLTTGGTSYEKAKISCEKMAFNRDYSKRKKSSWRPSEEEKRNLSLFHKGKKKIQNEKYWAFKDYYSKTIYMFDVDGNFIREFSRLGLMPSIFKASSVNKCCTGKQVTGIYKNHRFSYERYPQLIVDYKPPRDRVKIYKYDINLNEIKTYNSLYELRLDGFTYSTISARTAGNVTYKHKSGFLFSRVKPQEQQVT